MIELKFILPVVLNLVKYFLLAGIPFLVFYILWPNGFKRSKIQSRMAAKKDFFREISHSLQTIAVVGAIALLIIQTPLTDYTRFYRNISDYPIWWIPVSVILALVLHDAYFYWMHKTIHHQRLFKVVHLVHHRSINPSPWASFSFHLYESLLEALIAPILLLTIPMHPIALVTYGFLSFAINVYGHLGYEIAPKWFRNTILFEVFVTSTHHNLHHEKFKGNYGLYFRFWDRVMGTEHPDYVKVYDRVQAARFGRRKKGSFGGGLT